MQILIGSNYVHSSHFVSKTRYVPSIIATYFWMIRPSSARYAIHPHPLSPRPRPFGGAAASTESILRIFLWLHCANMFLALTKL